MSSFTRAAAAGFVLVAALAAAPAPAQQAPATLQAVDAAADPILAIVDGAAIRRSDMQSLQRALPAQFQQMPLEMLFPMLIDRMVDAKLLAIAGRRDNLQNEPELRARVATYEERLIQDAYLTRRIAAAATEEAVQARYRKFVAENPAETEVSARHIRTDDNDFIPSGHQLIRKRTHTRRHAIDNWVPAFRQERDSQRASLIASCAPVGTSPSASPDVSRIPSVPGGAK